MRASFQKVSVVRVELANGGSTELLGRCMAWCSSCSIRSPLDAEEGIYKGAYIGYHTPGDAERIRGWLGRLGVVPNDDGAADALVKLSSELVMALELVRLPEGAQRAERRLRACLSGQPCAACGAPVAGVPCKAGYCPWR